jgi:hypothetical protein
MFLLWQNFALVKGDIGSILEVRFSSNADDSATPSVARVTAQTETNKQGQIMKKISVLFAIVLCSTLSTWAADNFLIKVRGKIVGPNGVTRVKETDLVLTNGHQLVYQIDTTNQTFTIVQMDIPGTNVLRQELHADDAAVSGNHRVVAFDMHDDAGFGDNVGGVGAFTGRLVSSGRISFVRGTAKKIRLSVFGVWDSSENTTFKGVITGQRIP